MSFYAGSAGSVVVPTAQPAYGVPVTHSVHAQPMMTQQYMHHHVPAPISIAPTMHYQQPMQYAYAQPRAMPAVPLTANPLMYQSYGYGGYAPGYYPRGPPTVIISSSRSKRHRRHSSRGFLGYL
ncbi:hypothetical protein DFP72DRAFT_1068229 [Ephemerocybe angulata]|uniref:Uncharacterized protein n=1 Tax=Ephemerocybe angulata TaxID=980116 RepID=A0A8H6HRL1_9AGAR|nr:hypothetical protein DFP72DRAFT_1070935 [Tulosesus angulatus]KAF6754653.1 hypothetical protein DFP72DRAFT_1068229 [Tulosesus angulatus]